MATIFTTSGENEDNVIAPPPQLQGIFIPGIDNSFAIDGFGLITPLGGGSTTRKYTDYGISAEVSQQNTQLNDLALISPSEGAAYTLEGEPGPRGFPGRNGIDGIIHVMGLNLPQNSNFVAALPHNIDLINDLGTAANKLIYTDVLNTYTENVWTERQPAGDANAAWYVVASGPDGAFLLALIGGAVGLYTSANSGVDWTLKHSGSNWYRIATNTTGAKLIASIYSTRLYTSTNYGVNWTERQPAGNYNKYWNAVTSDSDGSNLMACEADSVWISSDSGVSWTEHFPAGEGSGNWNVAASDDDGSHLIVASKGLTLHTSANSGANWTERQPAGAGNKQWNCVASDSDGSNLIAGIDGGRLYISDDSGATWSETQPAGGVNKKWSSVASDSDGSHLIASVEDGRLYTSKDSGTTWEEERPAEDTDQDWEWVALDSDGSNLIAAVFQGRLYTGVATEVYSEATWAESDLTSAGRAILDDADAAAQAVTLGLVIGTDVQAWDTQLDDIAALAVTNSNFLVGDGSNWVAESGNTARTSLGLGTGDSPTFVGGTFTAVVTGILPTAGAHLATKEYVDLSLGARKSFFLSDTASGVGSLNLAYPRETGDAESTVVSGALGLGDAQLIKGFITETGEPGTTSVNSGVIAFDFHAKKGADNQRATQLYAVLSSVDADGTSNKTTIATSEITAELGDVHIIYHIHASVAETIEIAATARLILDVYANVGVGAQDSVVTLYMESNHDSHWDIEVSGGLWQNHGDILDDLNTLGAAASDGQFIVATGAGVFAYESTTTARTSLGVGESDTPTFNQVILGIAPTNVAHSVTKSYADALVAGAFWTDVDTGTTANVDLSNGLEAGDSIDGYTLVTGDRVLVKEQIDQTENGLYTVPASGAASRSADANTAAEIENKKCIPLSGDSTKHRLYFCITGDITLGVTNIQFAEVTQVSAHNTLSGIQGGQANEYFHLTSSEHVELNAWIDDVTLSNGGAMNLGTGALTAANYTAAALLTACATNAGEIDFTAASKKLDVEDNAVVSQDYSSNASPQFTGIELGHASDTTITRVSAGVIAVEGTSVMLVGDAPTAHTIASHSDTTATGANLNTLVGSGDVGALHTHAAAYQPKDAELTSLAALSYVAASFVKMTGANTFALRTIGETADDLEGTIDHDNLANGGAHDYSYVSGNDGATDVTAAQLEELSDGSETALHSHAGGAGTAFNIVLTPQCGIPPAANFATFDTIAGGSTPAEVVSVLDFDPNASEYMDFKIALPAGYASGGLTVTVIFSMTSDHDEGTPHKVRWEAAFGRIDDDGIAISADHAYDFNGVSATVPSVLTEVSYENITFTDGADMDSFAAGEMGILRIRRKHDHADDNATGDAELQMIQIKET